MNKKILTITILALVVCLAFAFAFANPVMADTADEGTDTQEEGSVALVNSKYYKRLDAAFQKANSGDTVTLVDNVTVAKESGNNGYVEFNKENATITLDMNGHNITSSYDNEPTFRVKNGTLTITNSRNY